MVGLASRSTLIWALILVPILSYLGGRFRILALDFYNAPGRMPLHANFSSYEIKFQDELQNCEDVLLLKDRPVALLACDPGRDNLNTVLGDFPEVDEIDPNAGIYAYNHQQPGNKGLKRFELIGFNDELRTIGLEYHEPSATLFVTNHLRKGGPRIEQFRLDLDAMTATHLRSISHPLLNSPNSIAAYNGEEFFVTNQLFFMPAYHPVLSLLETYFGPPLARIVHVRILPSGEIDASVVKRQTYPNGITFLHDESQVAVASSNKAIVYIYNVTNHGAAGHPTLKLEYTISNLPFLPDNVATTPEGALLIAGHPHLGHLGAFGNTRRICHRPEVLAKASDAEKEMCAKTQAGSWVSEWTSDGGLSHIYSDWEYPTACTAVRERARGFGIITGLYARGILVWKD